MSPSIRARQLGKLYRIDPTRTRYGTLRDSIVNAVSALLHGRQMRRHEQVWAIRDLSFEVMPGEVLGIIGPNGGGKTTLLKVLSRITPPTTGEAKLRGRVGSLLEVGTGFHPELTGRENVFLGGALLGMKRREIQRKLDEIVDFAGVQPFIDTPVKHYSSGMRVRLAFSVAAHLETEIILADEVLAVGDLSFQRKCIARMAALAAEGRTVLFVSHNLASIRRLCQRSMLLNAGSLVCMGVTPDVVNHYVKEVAAAHPPAPLAQRKDRTGSGRLRLVDFYTLNSRGERDALLESGEEARLKLSYVCPQGERPTDVNVAFAVTTVGGEPLLHEQSTYTRPAFDHIPQRGEFQFAIPRLPLITGHYLVFARVTIAGQEADYPLGHVGSFDVGEGRFFGTGNPDVAAHSPFLIDGHWSIAAACDER